MAARPAKSVPLPSRPRTALLRAENMPMHFYRYLYERIGKAHHWYERRAIGDEDLANIIHSPDTILEVLYAGGCPAGFFELTKSAVNEDVELTYFGLMPDYQGLGLGRWFLHSAIQRAWDEKPDKVTVHTNTLDHPSALGLYQKMGFSPVAVSEETVTVWD
jgi:GNAT superfamily N-acetyltransferase